MFSKFVNDSDKTIKQIAEELEKSDKTLYNWRSGISSPSLDSIDKLCDKYNISTSEFLPLATGKIQDNPKYILLKNENASLKEKQTELYEDLVSLQKEFISIKDMDEERIENFIYERYGLNFQDLEKLKK